MEALDWPPASGRWLLPMGPTRMLFTVASDTFRPLTHLKEAPWRDTLKAIRDRLED